MNTQKKYFYGIDFLRWVAAFGVVLYHYSLHFKITDIEYSSFLNYLVLNREFAQNFVWLFWGISGFVFTNIYISRTVTLKKFFISRIARLYPLHLITLLIVAILQLFSLTFFNHTQEEYLNDVYHFILHLFFASDWGLQNGWSFNVPVWSVSIEFPIYFLFFFSLFFIRKLKFIFPIIMVIFFYYILQNLVDLLQSNNLLILNVWQKLAFFNFVTCIFYFFMGCFIYFFYLKIKIYPKLVLITSLLTILFCLYMLNSKVEILPSLLNYFPSTVLLFFSLILFAACFDDVFYKLSKKSILLGNSSYSIYLIHFPLQLLILILLEKFLLKIEIFHSFFVFLIYVIILQIISFISFKYFESPLRKIINSKFS